MMRKKRRTNEQVPSVVEELAQIIEKALDQFPETERNARLDRIHLVLSHGGKPRRNAHIERGC